MKLRAVCVLLGVVIGCGGASSTDLTAPVPNDLGGGAADGGTTGTGTDGGPGSTPSSDGGKNPTDAGPGGDTSRLACGNTSCALPAEVCCVSRTNNVTAYACAVGTCPSSTGGNGSTAALACSDTANCGSGQVCCVRANNSGTISQCKATCGGNEAQLCDPTPGAVTGCLSTNGGNPRTCSSQNIGDWGLPSTYATCGGVGN